jgi:hypothetical protein
MIASLRLLGHFFPLQNKNKVIGEQRWAVSFKLGFNLSALLGVD